MSGTALRPSVAFRWGMLLRWCRCGETQSNDATPHCTQGQKTVLPAEAERQRPFGVSPPSVHSMILSLERAWLIRRQPHVARSIEGLIAPESLPVLR
jgi:DNA-binding transcriptional regulator YdaS (Cro superfamily)